MPRPSLSGAPGLVLTAGAMTTLGTLPVFLLSAQSVFVRDELGLDERLFGLVVSAFFAAAATTALVGGGLVDRFGQRVGTIVAGAGVAVGGFALAGLAWSWWALLLAMVLLGMANAACQVTSNLTVGRSLAPHRQGLGFGVKQAAIPLAIVISGVAVPLAAEGVGWRWTYVAVGAGGLVLVLGGLRSRPARQVETAGAATVGDQPPLAPLLVTMAAVTLASAAANSLGAFVPAWAFEVGLTPTEAGTLMAVGSAVNIGMRVLAGHLADRRHGRNLPVVALQMSVGAAALVTLSVDRPAAVVVGGLVAFAVGWSWPGLLLYAVVRIGRDAPARASGLVQAGAFAGGAAGPTFFGVAVSLVGYETAWRIAAAVFLAAAALIVVARRMFIADLVARPPSAPFRYGGGRVTRRRPDDQGGEPGGPSGP